jgi:hypothetical protein
MLPTSKLKVLLRKICNEIQLHRMPIKKNEINTNTVKAKGPP